jgi:peptidyl-prolyl cis-trans isomerase A (cyclophilin A)
MHKWGWMMITGLMFFLASTYNEMRAQAAQAAQAQVPSPPKAATGSTAAHKSPAASPYDRALLRPALLAAKAPAAYQVKFTTTKGDFVISVTRAWAPLGADRFYNLVRHHFYDNASFFRVHPKFVVQWGISAYPPVTAAWEHAPIKDDPVVQSNLRGYVTYAKTNDPDTRTAQVFINLVDNQRLDTTGGFAPFGQVTEGLEVVDALYSGYGEAPPDGQGPEQDKIERLGKAYLDKDFPNLDSVKTTTLVLPPGATPAKAPSAPKAAPTPATPKP